jgi:hypothetical protein
MASTNSSTTTVPSTLFV